MINTFWSVITISLLGSIDSLDLERLSDFINKCKVPGGGYSSVPGSNPFMEYTFEGLFLAKSLGLNNEIHDSKTITFVLNSQFSDGRFGERPHAPPTMGDTAWAISILSILEKLNCINFFELKENLLSLDIQSLWHYFCLLTSLIYLIPQEIIVKHIESELSVQRLKQDNILVDYRPFHHLGAIRSTPDILSIGEETINEISEDIQLIDQKIRECSRKKINHYDQDFRDHLIRIGRQLPRIVLSQRKAEKFRSSARSFFIVSCDPTLLGIPWELMYDEKNFACLKYAMTKEIITDIETKVSSTSYFPEKIKVLIIGNPKGHFERGLNLLKMKQRK